VVQRPPWVGEHKTGVANSFSCLVWYRYFDIPYRQFGHIVPIRARTVPGKSVDRITPADTINR
jgi:hypothetical protein